MKFMKYALCDFDICLITFGMPMRLKNGPRAWETFSTTYAFFVLK